MVTLLHSVLQVYHSLLVKAQARPGESILVNEGCSALGQAAIRVATQLGCSPIFTTARDQAQRQQLLQLFPQVTQHHSTHDSQFTFHFPPHGSPNITRKPMPESWQLQPSHVLRCAVSHAVSLSLWQLQPSHVLRCAAGGSFEFQLRMLTAGRGVRLVFNTLPGGDLGASLRCLAQWGRVLHHHAQDALHATTVGTLRALMAEG